MTTLGDSSMKMKNLQSQIGDRMPLSRTDRPSHLRRAAVFGPSNTEAHNSDLWHRALTGRQAPEPVSQKLKMIYGKVIAEQLPAEMLDLLSQLETKSAKN
jgi:hypothetical protein